MGRLNPLLFFLVVGSFVNAELVARQWAQIPGELLVSVI